MLSSIIRLSVLLCLLLFCGTSPTVAQSISGYIADAYTSELLPGVCIREKGGQIVGFSNQQGYFSVRPTHSLLTFSIVGYKTTDTLLLPQKSAHKVLISFATQQLKEVTVNNSGDNFYNNVIKISAREISAYPSIMGEKDLIKFVQTMPGIKRVIEGGVGFSVRGGAADQNLLLLDNVPMYSYNHLFGLFSMFNTDAVKDVELSKDAISAKYGGRASSVLNITLKDGSQTKWNGAASIGLLSSKVMVNGPVIKNKLTAIVSLRRSYLDLITRPFMSQDDRQVYVLNDVYGKLKYHINANNNIAIGYYGSTDKYTEIYTKSRSNGANIEYPFKFGWTNKVSYAQFTHAKHDFSFNTTAYLTDYNFFYNESVISSDKASRTVLSDLGYYAKIRDLGVKAEGQKYFQRTSLLFGGGAIYRKLQPQTILRESSNNNIPAVDQIQTKANLEAHVYLEAQTRLANHTTLNAGLRNVLWNDKKPTVYLEPRLSAIFEFSGISLKPAYFRINQFVHLLSNTGGAFPNDVWITANSYAKPVSSDQFSLSAMKSFAHGGHSFYIEASAYIKKMKNVVDYNNGQNLLSMVDAVSKDVENLSDVISVGKGFSKGVEILFRYRSGKLNSMVSYTLSRTFYRFEHINFGEKFFPGFDRLHDFSVNTSYVHSEKFSVSASLIAASANPVTLPTGIYNGIGFSSDKTATFLTQTSYVNYRNNYRIEPYYRLDIGCAFKKKKKRFKRIWEISIFNSTARKNPFYYTLKRELISQEQRIIKYSFEKRVFLTIVPSISYQVIF